MLFLLLEVTASQEIAICEADSLPTAFTLTCAANVTPAALVWSVSGLAGAGSRTITQGDSQGPFRYPTHVSNGEATLMVNDPMNMEVIEGTCFRCRDLTGSNSISTATCVNVTRE